MTDEVEVEKQEEVDVVNEEELDKQIASAVACCPCGNTNPLTTSIMIALSVSRCGMRNA